MTSAMWKSVGVWLAFLAVTAFVAWVGWVVVGHWSHTPEELRAESERLLAEPYTPYCDDEEMHPGDVCIVYGRGGGEGGSYDDYVERHRALLAPAELNKEDRYFRIAGYVIMGIGGVPFAGGVLVIVGALIGAIATAAGRAGRAGRWKAQAARHGWTFDRHHAGTKGVRKGPAITGTRVKWKSPPVKSSPPVLDARALERLVAASPPKPPKPPKRITRYTGRIVGTVIFGLIAWGGIALVRLDWPTLGRLLGGAIAAFGLLLGSVFVLALFSAWRTRVGRPWWARRHGATYTRRDPDLVRRLNPPGLRDAEPYADDILSGELDGQPFHIFDCLVKGTKRTVFVVIVPGRLPTIGETWSNAGKELFKDERLHAYRERLHKDNIATRGDLLVSAPFLFFSPGGRRLNQLRALGDTLLATQVTRT